MSMRSQARLATSVVVLLADLEDPADHGYMVPGGDRQFPSPTMRTSFPDLDECLRSVQSRLDAPEAVLHFSWIGC